MNPELKKKNYNKKICSLNKNDWNDMLNQLDYFIELKDFIILEKKYKSYLNRKLWKRVYINSLLCFKFDIVTYCENKFHFLHNDFQRIINSSTDIIGWNLERVEVYTAFGFNFTQNLNFYHKILKKYEEYKKKDKFFEEDEMFEILEYLKIEFKRNPLVLINSNVENVLNRHRELFKELKENAIIYHSLDTKMNNKPLNKKKKI